MPGASRPARAAREALEDPLLLPGREARALVGDRQDATPAAVRASTVTVVPGGE